MELDYQTWYCQWSKRRSRERAAALSNGEADGVDSFVEALAQENEDRFFLFESTAFGVNHWKAMWDSAANDPTVCRIFIGWWAQPTITCDDYGREGDPLAREYGREVADEIAARIRNPNND